MTRMRTTLGLVALLVGAFVLTGVAGISAGEQRESPMEHRGMMSGPSEMGGEMMAMHRKMQAEMQSMDERLDALVADMEAAEGDDKVDAIAAVVSELISQRKGMHTMMMEMRPRMMHQMMQQMASGMMHGMQHSMGDCPMKDDCPMMQQAPSEEEPVDAGDHAEHHPEG